MPPDYHAKPLLGVRVGAELQDWGRAEAKRRDQSFGDFVAALFAAERDRVNHVDNQPPARVSPPRRTRKPRDTAPPVILREPCQHRVQPGAWCKTCQTTKPGGK